MESKDLLTACRQAGIDVKNQLSTLDPDQVTMVEQMVRKGQSAPVAVQTAPLQAPPSKIRNLDKRPPVLTPRPSREAEAAKAEQHPPAAPAAPTAPERPEAPAAAAKGAEDPPHPAETPAARTPEAPAPRSGEPTPAPA